MDLIITWVQRFIVLFAAITVHEFAHGYVAYLLGDPTAKNAGRLTLNPISHLDPIGALCMVVAGFGWAKPVPINPMFFRNRKRDTAIVSFAGPLANIALTFVSTIIYVPCFWLYIKSGGNAGLWFVVNTLRNLAMLNISFAVFNLIPIPPLDGSKILSTVLPTDAYMKLLEIERFGFPVLILLSISGALGRLLNVLIMPVYNLWAMFANWLFDLLMMIVR